MSSIPTDPWPWPPPSPTPRGLRGLWLRHRTAILLAVGSAAVLGVAVVGWGIAGGHDGPGGAASSAAGPPGPSSGTVAAGPGALVISSLPSGATVLLDNRLVGTTPLRFDDVPPGARTLTFAADGYAPLDTVVHSDPARPTSVFVVLRARRGGRTSDAPRSAPQPAYRPPRTASSAAPPAQQAPPPRGPGTLQVRVLPWGTIMIDGAVRARETDVQHVETLPPGRHVVRAIHPVLGAREVTVDIRPGATTDLEIDLN